MSHLSLHKGGIKEVETCGAPSLYWGRLVRFGETYAVLSPFAGGRLIAFDKEPAVRRLPMEPHSRSCTKDLLYIIFSFVSKAEAPF